MSQLLASETVNSFLLVYAALFSIVNPLSGAPVFLSLTRRYPPRVRDALAGRIALNGFLLLLGSLFVGSHVLEFFGLTLPVVRVAGGLVVTSAGWTQMAAATCSEKTTGSFTCWTLDQRELDVWVRPSTCTMPAPPTSRYRPATAPDTPHAHARRAMVRGH